MSSLRTVSARCASKWWTVAVLVPFQQASAQKELEDSWHVYAELQRLVEQNQAELVETIATKQREAERHAQELARGLENELSQLRRRSSDLEAHAQMHDKILFLQVFKWAPVRPGSYIPTELHFVELTFKTQNHGQSGFTVLVL